MSDRTIRGTALAVFAVTVAVSVVALLLDWLARGASPRDELGPRSVQLRIRRSEGEP